MIGRHKIQTEPIKHLLQNYIWEHVLALGNTRENKTNEKLSIAIEHMDKVNRYFVKIYMSSTFINYQSITMFCGIQISHIGFPKSISEHDYL